MIPPEVWIPQIVDYAGWVSDPENTRRAWVEGDHSETSVTDYDELYEQVFDDLDADGVEAEALAALDPEHARAIREYLQAMRDADNAIAADPALSDASTLLKSDAWRRVELAGARVMAAFA
jgi:hypothetical protein